jgi:hypothetical protein
METNQESTIHTDVPNAAGDEVNTEQTPASQPLSPREEALARIDQANLEQINQKNTEYRQANGEPEPTPEEGRTEPVVEVQPVPAEQTVRVKVDGVEMELPISEVVKNYQKDTTADKRLKEAALRLKEVEEREKALVQVPAERANEGQTPSGQPDESAREKAQRVISAMLEGDTEGAVEDLAEIFSVKPAPAPAAAVIDQDQVSQLVQEGLRQQEFDREFKQAQATFAKDHADLNENPTLAGMVNQHYTAALEAGFSPLQATDYAVKEVRQFVTELTGKAGNSAASTIRQERKQTYDTITPAAGRVDLGNQQQADDNSPAAVIRQMREARGQA